MNQQEEIQEGLQSGGDFWEDLWRFEEEICYREWMGRVRREVVDRRQRRQRRLNLVVVRWSLLMGSNSVRHLPKACVYIPSVRRMKIVWMDFILLPTSLHYSSVCGISIHVPSRVHPNKCSTGTTPVVPLRSRCASNHSTSTCLVPSLILMVNGSAYDESECLLGENRLQMSRAKTDMHVDLRSHFKWSCPKSDQSLWIIRAWLPNLKIRQGSSTDLTNSKIFKLNRPRVFSMNLS